jgi:hypothetical protein
MKEKILIRLRHSLKKTSLMLCIGLLPTNPMINRSWLKLADFMVTTFMRSMTSKTQLNNILIQLVLLKPIFYYKIGYLEPSYVIGKFLDVSHVDFLIQYLSALHSEKIADKNHTALLLNCYVK